MDTRVQKFEASGKAYEVRAMQDENGWRVQCFHGSQRVGPRYHIEWDTDQDYKFYHGESAIGELMKVAEHDIRVAIGDASI